MLHMTNFEKLTEHTSVDVKTQMTTRSCTLGAISLEKYAIAIDTGNPLDIGIKVRKELEEHIKLPIDYLFLTHAHSDHRGGMGAFKDSKLLISEKCKENMPKSTRLRGWTVETFDSKFMLQEKDVTVEFHHTGGHSLGSSIAYVPNEGVLFAGDLFFEETINLGLPFLGIYRFTPRMTGNPEECLLAFQSFKSMKLDYIVPGHGKVIERPSEYLDIQIEFYNSLKSFIISEINEGKKLEDIEIPRIGPIDRAYHLIESKSQKYKAKKFMVTIEDWLKKAFYNHYSQNK